MKKTTEQLINEIKKTKNINKFLDKNSIEKTDLSLSEYLRSLLEKYKLEKSDIFRRALMTGSNYGYELFRDDTKKASRDKLIQLCFGFPLTIEETQNVLCYGKFRTLYPRDKRDAYIIFALINKYNMTQLNDLLLANGLNIFE